MAATSELSVWLRLKDEASKQLESIAGKFESFSKTMRPVAIAAGAFGAALTSGVVMAVKAAEEERVSQAKLAVMLKNVGVSYDSVKTSLEKVIQVTMSKTAVSDEDQRNALVQLLLITGNYELALKALPVALDLAAAKGTSVETAATLLAKALNGDTDALLRMGIEIPKGTGPLETLQIVLDKVKGSAEGNANHFSVMATGIGEIVTAIGTTLLGDLETFATNVGDIATNVTDWIDKNPDLVKGIAQAAFVLGTVLMAVSAFIVAAPGFAAAGVIMGGGATAALGPWGVLIVVIVAVIAAAALLILNWDKAKALFLNIMGHIADGIRQMVNNAIDNINTLIGGFNWLINKIKELPLIVKTLVPALGLLSLIPEIATIPNIVPPAALAGPPLIPSSDITGFSTPTELETVSSVLGKALANQTAQAPVNVTINGWVGNDQDIAKKVQEALTQIGKRNAQTALGEYA